MAVYNEQFSVLKDQSRFGAMSYYAGGVISIALLIGVIVWGYQLVVRDVSGVPVIKALGGQMRVAPDDPGGQISRHQGLSVNMIAAEGEAAAPEDRLILAPAETGAMAEDLAAQPQIEVQSQPRISPALSMNAHTSQAVDAFVPQNLDERTRAELLVAAQREAVMQPQSAVRPRLRPASLEVSAVEESGGISAIEAAVLSAAGALDAAAGSSTTSASIVTQSIPAGTIMVQLGAFPSAQQAAEHWRDLHGKFAPYMQEQTRVIQEATRGGSNFYRLRASGFGALNDARRFCTTFVSNGVECIPAVAR